MEIDTMNVLPLRRPPAGASPFLGPAGAGPTITIDPSTADFDPAIVRIDSHPAFLTSGASPEAAEHNSLAWTLARALEQAPGGALAELAPRPRGSTATGPSPRCR